MRGLRVSIEMVEVLGWLLPRNAVLFLVTLMSVSCFYMNEKVGNYSIDSSFLSNFVSGNELQFCFLKFLYLKFPRLAVQTRP